MNASRSSMDFRRGRSGQALIETALLMAVLCLVLFGVFQLAQVYASKEIVTYAAEAGARSRTVGFNDFMVHKVVRTATIPNAGRMITPEIVTSSADASWYARQRPGALIDRMFGSQPGSPQLGVEQSRIPLYLGTTHYGELQAILDYADWDTVRSPYSSDTGSDQMSFAVRQDLPLRYPFHRAFVDGDDVPLSSELGLEYHSNLYLE